MKGKGPVVLTCIECGATFRCFSYVARRGRRFCSMACFRAYHKRNGTWGGRGRSNDRTAILHLENGPLRRECAVSWCNWNTTRGCEIGGCRKKVEV